MGAKAEWRGFAAAGMILVGITFTDFSPEGPWSDATFTSGFLGLIGIVLIYLAWFRLTFETTGVVPSLDMWKDPKGTSPLVIGVGLVILGIAYAVGRIDFFPEPAGLILALIGLLVTTNGLYVWMSTVGPLKDQIDSQENLIEEKIEEDSSNGESTVIYNIQNIEIKDSVVIDSKFTTDES